MQHLDQGDRSVCAAPELVVVVHGFGATADTIADVLAEIRKAKPGADIYCPNLPHGNLLSVTPATNIVATLLADVDEVVAIEQAVGGYERIVLVGHSFGGLLVRKLFIAAHGGAPDVELRGKPVQAARPWAWRIERIVFLAAVNKGWELTSAADALTSFAWNLGIWFARIGLAGYATILESRRGSPFLVETRLQWLRLMETSQPSTIGGRLKIVQIIGTIDDVVSPDDAIDFVVDDSRPYFHLFETPATGHKDAVVMRDPGPSASAAEHRVRARRRELLVLAVTGENDALDRQSINLDLYQDSLPQTPDMSVKDVVFVVHGIRDRGFWTQKIARKIKEKAFHHGRGREFRSMTATYGYFPMLPFVLPWTRQDKVAWLMERYVEARAQFPKADFSYFGHSNGTYLLANALRRYPSCHFKNVAFAGSVVRTDYGWQDLVAPTDGRPPKVRQFLNYVATGDWVVAIFPKALERLRFFDLGGAGHDGFRSPAGRSPEIAQIEWIAGGHGAGIQEAQWDEVAEFIVTGRPPLRRADTAVSGQAWWCKAAGRGAPIPLFLLIAIAMIPVALIWWTTPIHEPGAVAGALAIIALMTYLWLLSAVVMKL